MHSFGLVGAPMAYFLIRFRFCCVSSLSVKASACKAYRGRVGKLKLSGLQARQSRAEQSMHDDRSLLVLASHSLLTR
jgi:hypothetical protein